MSNVYPESEMTRGMFKKRGGSKNASQNNWNTTECAETELCLAHQSCVVGRVERTDAKEGHKHKRRRRRQVVHDQCRSVDRSSFD